VKFNSGSATLKASSYDELNNLSAILTDQAAVKLSINGHTDNVGNPDNNRALSQRRAQAVMDYLVGKGIDGGRLQAQGFGADQPVASNDTSEGKAQNRRTEVEIVQ